MSGVYNIMADMQYKDKTDETHRNAILHYFEEPSLLAAVGLSLVSNALCLLFPQSVVITVSDAIAFKPSQST